MELAQRIIDYFGEDLYTELDVTEDDYANLPAYEFYGKVVDSCRELRPDVIESLRDVEEEPAPWKSFDSWEEAERFLSGYAKARFYLCVDILADIFYRDGDYRVHPTRAFYDMRDIWWNRAKEEGRGRFLERVKRGKDSVLWGPYSLGSIRALARRIAPSKCARYCLLRGIMRRENGRYVVWDESPLVKGP